MIIDVLFIIFLVIAVVKGYQRGLIVGVFSFLAFIIGLAAALKLSAFVAGYIGQTVEVSKKWLPVISFLVVFIVVVLLVRLGARAVQGLAEAIALGWLNRLGGIVFYLALYITIFSVLLFYGIQLHLLNPEAVKASETYAFVKPWGPYAINIIGAILPVFRNMFEELERFFAGIAPAT